MCSCRCNWLAWWGCVLKYECSRPFLKYCLYHSYSGDSSPYSFFFFPKPWPGSERGHRAQMTGAQYENKTCHEIITWLDTLATQWGIPLFTNSIVHMLPWWCFFMLNWAVSTSWNLESRYIRTEICAVRINVGIVCAHSEIIMIVSSSWPSPHIQRQGRVSPSCEKPPSAQRCCPASASEASSAPEGSSPWPPHFLCRN